MVGIGFGTLQRPVGIYRQLYFAKVATKFLNPLDFRLNRRRNLRIQVLEEIFPWNSYHKVRNSFVQPFTVFGGRLNDCVEQNRRILNCARNRPRVIERIRKRNYPFRAHQAIRRLQPDDPTKGRRLTNRSSGISPDCAITHSRSDCRRRSARRSSANDLGILIGDPVEKLGARGSCSYARSINQIFQTDWNSVKRASPAARLNLRLRLLCFGKCRFISDRDKGVQRRIQPCNNLKALANQLHWRDSAAPNQLRSLSESSQTHSASSYRARAIFFPLAYNQ